VSALDFIYILSERVGEWVFEVPPGKIMLDASKTNLWRHPHVVLWHEFLFKLWEPTAKPLALILPCTSVKPYMLSATHRLAESIIKREKLSDQVVKYTLSEPMILVPEEVEVYYPFANYNYPPHLLGDSERELFVKLLSAVLRKIIGVHKRIVAVLPKHHERILRDALRICGAEQSIDVISYGKLAFKSVSHAVKLLKHTR